MSVIKIIRAPRPLDNPAVLELLDILRGGRLTALGAGELDVPAIVSEVIARVAAGGAEAVSALTREIDQREIASSDLRVAPEALEAAHAAADPDFMQLARRVIANIRRYQEHIRHRDPEMLVDGGRRLGVRYTPIDRVGLYVPGWRAIYPSSVLMTLVPAQVAGVREIAIAGPPTDSGVHPMTMALAWELGISEVYRVGGAIAIAAMALGAGPLRPVQMIAGPGNAFVAEAKSQLAGRVAIDSVAGASEVLIVADETARATLVAADLLAQAEHNPGSAVLVTTSMALAQAVAAELEDQLAGLGRAAETRRVLELYSGVIVVDDLAAAAETTNAFAPEHLQIMTADNAAMMKRIRHAGAIFLGEQTPVPVGDYVAGPSHVLPTRSTARFSSALSANSFLKATSVIEYDAAALSADAADIMTFANHEGLDAHAAAVAARLKP